MEGKDLDREEGSLGVPRWLATHTYTSYKLELQATVSMIHSGISSGNNFSYLCSSSESMRGRHFASSGVGWGPPYRLPMREQQTETRER